MTEPATNPVQPGIARKAEAKPKTKKERQIEIALPLSVNKEIAAFVGENPVRKKIQPELEAAIRKVGAEAAAAAIVGKIEGIYAGIR